jgi:outer membrane biosynthesis protein TonB
VTVAVDATAKDSKTENGLEGGLEDRSCSAPEGGAAKAGGVTERVSEALVRTPAVPASDIDDLGSTMPVGAMGTGGKGSDQEPTADVHKAGATPVSMAPSRAVKKEKKEKKKKEKTSKDKKEKKNKKQKKEKKDKKAKSKLQAGAGQAESLLGLGSPSAADSG